MNAVRTGSCLGCGWRCCTVVGVPMTPDMLRAYGRNEPVWATDLGDEDYNRWLAVHGLAPTFPIPPDAEVKPLGAYWVALFPATCRYLLPDGRCGIYGQPDRPQICADWPSFPWELEALAPADREACGYRFVQES